jgi:acetyl esterase/lipase
MTVDRRIVLGIGAAVIGQALAEGVRAQSASPPASPTAAPTTIAAPPEPRGILSEEVVELWPQGRVPGSGGVTLARVVLERGSAEKHDRAVTHVTRPMLEVFRPARPNGAAVILMPGGGYVRLAVDKEGAMGARFLVDHGVTAFVLNYRLPGDGWAAGLDAPLQDAQRAVRLVRANARRWGLDTARIGVMGFSAGGHLAGALLTRSDAATYAAIDAADGGSARPDLAVLAYAVMTGGSLGIATGEAAARPLDQNVRAGLAPTFLVHAADDRTVPVANSLAMFQALQAVKTPAELHVFQEGGHGFGFALPTDRPGAMWPQAFLAWATRGGFLRG